MYTYQTYYIGLRTVYVGGFINCRTALWQSRTATRPVIPAIHLTITFKPCSYALLQLSCSIVALCLYPAHSLSQMSNSDLNIV